MERETILKLAAEAGFAMAEVIDADQVVMVPEYRKFCEENRCGNYGKNYGCPPACGSVQDMMDRVRGCRRAIVFQSKTPVKDITDGAETKLIKKMHTRMTLKAMELLEKNGMCMDGFPIMAGPCNLCDVCKMPEGKPCPHENLRFSCLSAYCVDAAKLAEACGMELKWNGEEVSFFSLYVFDRK